MADWHADPPIYAAVTSRRFEGGRAARVAELLAAGEDPNATDWRGYPPLGTYAAWDDHDLLRQLLDGGGVLQTLGITHLYVLKYGHPEAPRLPAA